MAVIPLILLVAFAAMQVGVAGWTVLAAGQAARDAARAASLERDPWAAADGALPDTMTLVSVSGTHQADGYRSSVTVRIPSFVIFTLPQVTRSAEMPVIQ